MAIPFPVPTRRDTPEWLDSPHSTTRELSSNLADIRLLNRWFGGTALAVRAIQGFAANRPRLSVLDLATGSADIPLALLKQSARSGLGLEITALDCSDAILAHAAHVTAGTAVRLIAGDARSLPWPNGTFDVALCCLALHHFEPRDAIVVLREMWRVSRVGIAVTDLTRGYAAYAGTWLATHTVAHNRMTRHDGPLSVLRAYTPPELGELAHAARLLNITVRTHPFFRQTLTASQEPGASGQES